MKTTKRFILTLAAILGMATTPFDLTLADGSSANGTVTFTVGGETVNKACYDDVVTVSVTPAEGYSAKDVTVRAYTSWEAASAILTGGGDNPGLVSDINVTKQEDGTWQFTMPEANVWVVVTYAKNLQDAWIQAIADQTYTGSAITPTVTVKDGETTLTLNTDYTVDRDRHRYWQLQWHGYCQLYYRGRQERAEHRHHRGRELLQQHQG